MICHQSRLSSRLFSTFYCNKRHSEIINRKAIPSSSVSSTCSFQEERKKKRRFKPTDANDTNQLIWKFSYGRWQRLTFSDVPVFHFHPITQLLHSLSPSLCLILCLFVNVNAIKSISLSLNQNENQHRSFGILRIYFTRLKWMAYTTIYLKAYWQFVHMVWKSKAA